MTTPIGQRDAAAPHELDALLCAARAGDPRAFDAIYARFVRVVHGIVLGSCSFEEAEDLTQDVFFNVHRKLDTIADAAALPAWICQVARNASIDHARRRARRPVTVELPELAGHLASDDETLARDVLARVRELPPSYRETLVLRLVEGLSGPEIAQATGMTEGSVRVNLHRGMGMLRERLAADGWP